MNGSQAAVAPRITADGPLHFQIGVIGVTLQSRARKFLDEFAELYAGYRVEEPAADFFRFEVTPHRRHWWGRKGYLISGSHPGTLFAARDEEVLPYLEWAINWHIAIYFTKYLQVHASMVECSGSVFLFPGSPGSGKSTLAAGLLARGARYYSDEFALIDPATGDVHAYPKALCIKEPSIAVIEAHAPGLALEARWIKKRKGRVAFLNPRRLRDDPIAAPLPVRFIVFPKYQSGSVPSLQPISKGEAAFNLNRNCFNFLDYREQGIHLLADVVRRADCYSLVSGDLEATCRLITSLAAASA